MEIINVENNIILRKKKKKNNEKIDSSLFSIYKSEKTIKDYMFYLKKFLEFTYENVNFNSQNEIIELMVNVDKDDVEEYIKHLVVEKKLKNSSINKIIFSLKSLYKELEKKGANNPFKFIPSMKHNAYNLDNILKISFEEIQTILINFEKKDDISYRNYTILYTLFYTGMRSSELLNLKYNNIITRNNEKVLKLEKTKSGKIQYKPLFEDCYNEIMKYKKYIKNIYNLKEDEMNEYYIFPTNFITNKKMSYNNLYKIIKDIGKLANKNISPHNIRHSVATELSLQGADVLEIRDFLGHSDTKVTEIYINAKGILEKKALNRLPKIRK
ncbi:integrase/recombinase XerD [Hypnocyclicus thermotrophus]|uniref:Integrase/recombinase XerD n=1 Tax=Hypnocyclicus thermotrophus TaxID=1627895 RepID=A0AA46DWX7_9FUSO|nr:site-specific integrase [Hypnocyclicus thermotrophus]TDT66969.1 integrase/recombinase XerD [Hypnocyclicus thermotrophus]